MSPASRHRAMQRPSTHRRSIRPLACTLLLLAMAATAGHAQEQPWRTTASKDGIRIEARPVAGARFDQLRVSTSLAASPDAVVDYLFGQYLDERNRNIRVVAGVSGLPLPQGIGD